MSLPEPSFIDRDPAAITAEMVAQYEGLTKKTLYPAQVERLLINVIAYRETLVRIGIQEAAKQNLVAYPRRNCHSRKAPAKANHPPLAFKVAGVEMWVGRNKKPAKPVAVRVSALLLAEAVRFELTNGCPLLVFKTSAIDHSATPPFFDVLGMR